MQKVTTALFVFRRDLRMHDNTGLNYALQHAQQVIPIFIFDPRQVSQHNDYRSMNALQFMTESLQSLNDQFEKQGAKLYLFYGKPEAIVKKLIKECAVNLVAVNQDYTPFSLKRDKELEILCEKLQVKFVSTHDILLTDPQAVKSRSGTPYSIFSAFYKSAARQFPVANPVAIKNHHFFTKTIASTKPATIYKKICPKKNANIAMHGGRDKGLAIIKDLCEFKDYNLTRDIPALPTTHLSSYLKFGAISIREVYHAIKEKLGPQHPLIRQLYWRDFFTHVVYHSPFVFGQPFHKKYKNLWWNKSKKDFERWCTGTTGFPIVDAGMRELNTTGFMHNRVRMIVASFLTKDLHINWQWGEKYFAQQLVDYDPAVNNGNWQWCASTGCDAQPYFRIFNPWLQQKKFDPKCVYIKKWVPELQNVKPTLIHNWFKENSPVIEDYPRPMIDHEAESKKAKKLYQSVLRF